MLSAIKTIKSKTLYVECLCDIANLMAAAGYIEHISYLTNESLKTLQEINAPDYSRDRLPEIIEAMAKGGLTEQAISLALNIEDDYARHASLQSIAYAYALAKKTNDALDLISEIKDAQVYRQALTGIVTAMCDASLPAEAFRFLQNDESSSLSSTAYVEVAVALSKAGFTEEANQVVTFTNISALSLKQAELLAEAGFIEQATQIVGKSLSQQNKLHLRFDLFRHADVIVRTGFSSQALSLALSTQDYQDRVRIFSDVAWARAKNGEIEEALEVANQIKWTGQRIITFARIAVALAVNGHAEAAVKVCEDVRCGIGEVADDEERSEGYAGLAIAQAKLQKY